MAKNKEPPQSRGIETLSRLISHTILSLRLITHGGNKSALARELNMPRSTVTRRLRVPGRKKKIRRFVVTYAQNNTKVHQGTYESIITYCLENKAELIVFAGTYRNPTSPTESRNQKNEVWWDQRVLPFLLHADEEVILGRKLMIFPAKIQPTAVNPLSGFDTHTMRRSGIFPHPKNQLRTVPTGEDHMPKILTTTGAITEKNYSLSKAGAKAKWWHTLGATVVELLPDDTFYMRNIYAKADTGFFYDIAGDKVKWYKGLEIEEVNRIDTIVTGDDHYPFIYKPAEDAGYRLRDRFKAKRHVRHDIVDFWAGSHHELNNKFLQYAKAKLGKIDIEKELEGAFHHYTSNASEDCETLIVISNHDDFVEKWLNNADMRTLGLNAKIFHELWFKVLETVKEDETISVNYEHPLIVAFQKFGDITKFNMRFLRRSENEEHLEIVYNYHGDKGPNGSRGTPKNLSKIGVKAVIGHSHSPAIIENVYQVGVSCNIPLGYAAGSPSSWLHTHVIVYPDGKRQMLHIINGKYCAT